MSCVFSDPGTPCTCDGADWEFYNPKHNPGGVDYLLRHPQLLAPGKRSLCFLVSMFPDMEHFMKFRWAAHETGSKKSEKAGPRNSDPGVFYVVIARSDGGDV